MPENCTFPKLRSFVVVPQSLLDEATRLWHQSLTAGGQRTEHLLIDMPANWKPDMNRRATQVRMTLNPETGLLYGLDEVSSSIHGGWSGSCMPRHRVNRPGNGGGSDL